MILLKAPAEISIQHWLVATSREDLQEGAQEKKAEKRILIVFEVGTTHKKKLNVQPGTTLLMRGEEHEQSTTGM